ncbi:MAG: hypothetical protein MZV63_28225 [Marinilabiliales bacterium]|nr:hypothetical protein [Marinilabiliales bacterium]
MRVFRLASLFVTPETAILAVVAAFVADIQRGKKHYPVAVDLFFSSRAPALISSTSSLPFSS